MSKERNIGLDLIRIFACTAVVTLHGICTTAGTYTLYLYYFCGFAVPCFFTITGYFLFSKENISEMYLIKKASRYLRLIIIWSIIMYVVDDMLLVINGGKALGIGHFIEIFLGSLFCSNWLSHLWYLWAMLIVYICLVLIIALCRRLKINNYILKCWLIFLSVSIILQIISYINKRPEVIGTRYNFCRTWTYLQYVFLGGLIPNVYEAFKKHISLRVHTILFVCYSFAATLYFSFICQKIYMVTFVHNMYDSLVMIFWIIIIFTLVLRVKIKSKILTAAAERIAPLTLGIYILQSIVLAFFYNVEWMDYPNGSVVRCGIVFLICLGLSWIIKKIPGSKYCLSV